MAVRTERYGQDLDARIAGLEKTVGTPLYRNILRECGRVNQPKLIRDPAVSAAFCSCLNRQPEVSLDWKQLQSGWNRKRLKLCWRNSKPRLWPRSRT